MSDFREIDYLLDANASEAISEVNKFMAELSKAQNQVAALENQIKRLYRLDGSAPIGKAAKQIQSQVSSISKGDLDTQLKHAGQRAKLATIQADEATRLLKIQDALTKQQTNQLKVLDGFVPKYDRIVQARTKLAELDKQGLASSKAYAQELAVAQKNIQSIVQTLPPSRQPNMQARLTNVLENPNYSAGGRYRLANDYYRARTAGNMTPTETRALVGLLDDRRDMARLEAAQKARNEQLVAMNKLDQQRMNSFIQAQKSMHAKLLREYKSAGIREVFLGGDAKEMDRLHEQQIARMEQRFRTTMGQSFGPNMPVAFDRSQFDEQYGHSRRLRDVRLAEQERRETLARESQVIRDREKADRQQQRMMLMEQRQRDRIAMSGEQGMLGARRRMDAFGGAGIMSIQGSLLANYAMMGAGLGSASYLITSAVELETALAKLKAIATATDGEMAQLEDTIIDLARGSKYGGEELSEAATTMAQAGLTADQINRALPSVVKLATATDTALDVTVDTITSTMTVFDIQTSRAAEVADVLTAAMNRSKLSIDKYALGLQYAGNISDTVGIQFNELAALLGGMSDAGIRSGSTLGTGLRQLLLDLQSPTDKANDVFKRLGLNKSDIDIESQGIFRVLRNLKEAGFSTADATEAFEVRAVAAFKALMNKLPDIEELNRSILNTAAAEEAAATQMDTLSTRFGQFASGAGTSFYRSTEGIRESLKGVFLMLTSVFTVIDKLAPVLNVATTAGAAFVAVWAVNKVKRIVGGLFEMQAQMTGLTKKTDAAAIAQARLNGSAYAGIAAFGRLAPLLALVTSPIVILTAAITAASFAWQQYTKWTERHERALEKAKEASARSVAAMDETKETIESVNNSLERLTNRYAALSDEESPDLRTEISQLRNEFSLYGLTLEETGENVDTLINKMVDLREGLAATLALQTKAAIMSNTATRDAEAVNLANNARERGRTPLSNVFSIFGMGNQEPMELLRASTRLGRNDQTAPIAELYKPYEQLMRSASAEDIKALRIADVQRDLAAITEIRAELFDELTELEATADADPRRVERLKAQLADISLISGVIRDFERDAKTMYGYTREEEQLTASNARFTSTAVADRIGLTSAVQTGLGQSSVLLDQILDADPSEVGPDYIASRITELQNSPEFSGLISFVEAKKQELFNAMIIDGLAVDDAEAERLFEELPFYDDYKQLTTMADRSKYRTLEDVRDLQSQVSERQIAATRAGANALLQRARVRNGLSVPDSGVEFTPIGFDEAITELDRLRDNQIANVKAGYLVETPNLFEQDEEGRYKNPLKLDDYQQAIERELSQFEAIRSQIYRAFGTEYDPEGQRRDRSSSLEILKGRASALKTELSEMFSSVDSNSSPDAISEVIGAYTAKFDQLEGVMQTIESMEWDRTKFEDPEEAAEAKAQRLAELQRELEAVGGKKVTELNEVLAEALYRNLKGILDATERELEAQLNATTAVNSPLSRSELRTKLDIGRRYIEQMAEGYERAFLEDPDNAGRLDLDETKRQLAIGMAEFITKQTEFALTVIGNHIQAQMLALEDQYARGQLPLAIANNDVVGPSLSNTQRGIMQREFEAGAQVDYLRGRMSIAGQNVSAVEDELTANYDAQREAELAGEQERLNQLRNNAVEIEGRLAAARRELTAATLEYKAATGTVEDMSPGELFTGALEEWVMAEGVLLSASETMADSLGSIFSTMRNSITGAVTDVVSGTASISDAFRSMGQSIFKSILDMAMKILTNMLIMKGLELIASMLPGGGFSKSFVKIAAASGIEGLPIKKRHGDLVSGPTTTRDSQLIMAQPGEFMMRKSAVDMIGVDTLRRANATGKLAHNTAVMMAEGRKREPDNVNVWVVSPDQQPQLTKSDILVTIGDDFRQNGPLKKMVQSVAVGGR